ncbi:SusD family protein [Saccharicrinis carchari]|uniref:SusD family protein n=1 Tax=Saccharicrinis carchari TaxID=1168039 RepID=A0A521C6K8_SACCC|nr:RagB/SusD family nutrient uptake outer membrane protein [Saccharicrinis carchari]SMO55044.1 SusD family protein [Saccharicrinis carchari]
MKNILIQITIAIAILTLVSCDDFLDINPESEVVNDDMFSNKRGIEDAIYGLYGKMKSPTLYGENLAWAYTEVLAQNYNGPNALPYNDIENYNFEDAKSDLGSIWQKAYEVIGHANNIIVNLEGKEAESYELYHLYLGETYGIRAFLHFDLIRLFAPHIEQEPEVKGIPYVKSYSFEHTDFSSVSAVYDFIIQDLKKAQELLKADDEYVQYPRILASELNEEFLMGRQLHFNYYAATATLARVYWMKGDLEKAKTEALKVINSTKFPLVKKDEIVNLIAGHLSPKESIWGLFSTDYFNTTETRLYQSTSWASFSPYDPSSGGSYLMPYKSVYAQYQGENHGNDARLGWFRPAVEGGISPNCLKVVDVKRINSGEGSDAGKELIEGISMIRIPEMYYIASEAELEAGNTEMATQLIDEVLQSRGMTRLADRIPALTLDIDLLYNERHKELFGEGQRWFEMKKKNMDIVSNAENKIIPASNDVYVLPIPIEEYEYRND